MADHELSRIPVQDRPRPDFDPVGYSVGSIFFYPQLTSGLRYDSNVFAAPSGRRSDIAWLISPRLSIRSQAGNFSHNIDLGADVYRFRRLSSENRIDAHARYRGRAELSRDVEIETRLEAARRHIERGDSASPDASAEPIAYTDLRAEAAVTRNIGRGGAEIGGTARRLIYEDSETVAGAPLDQSWRNGTLFGAYVKPFYEVAPGYRVFVRAEANWRDYAGTGLLNRDSRGYDLRGGIDFHFTPLLFGSFDVGYLRQFYSNPAISPVTGLAFAAELTWLFTALTTVRFKAERTIADMAMPDAGARIDTSAGARVDHELLRNVTLFAEGKYTREVFRGMSRRDDVIRISAGFDYLMNRHLRLGARYEFIDRNSSLSPFSFDKHVVMFNATAQY